MVSRVCLATSGTESSSRTGVAFQECSTQVRSIYLPVVSIELSGGRITGEGMPKDCMAVHRNTQVVGYPGVVLSRFDTMATPAVPSRFNTHYDINLYRSLIILYTYVIKSDNLLVYVRSLHT